MKKNSFLLFLILILGTSCSLSKRAKKMDTPVNYQFPYDLQQADVTFELPKSLNEVSGIAFTKRNEEIVAVQDESGIIFYLDKETGEVLRQKVFHKKGDYEDIELVGDDIYIIKSSGSLYRLEETKADTFRRTKYKIARHKEHDFEGLCLDKKNNRLLIACKGVLSKSESYDMHKGIRAFNLETKQLEEKPCFSISLDAIEHYIQTKGSPEMRTKFAKVMAEDDGQLGLAPSAVAIHPISGNIYITSSKGKVLLVLSPSNEILHIQKLDKLIHRQPEGILFDTDGTLYICNEAKDDDVAKIYRFDLN